MLSRRQLLSTAVLFSLWCSTVGYHLPFENSRFHCWMNIGANKNNSFPCEHVNFKWIGEIDKEVIEGRPFNMSYTLEFEDNDPMAFYQWLLDSDFMPEKYRTAEEVDHFCNEECGDPGKATIDNCCIWHYNIIACPLGEIKKMNDICGPWIEPSKVFTHTPNMASKIMPWKTEVVLGNPGQSSIIIAHIRIGKIQMALGTKVRVYAKANCGDYFCDERTEDCDSCKMDCCPGLKTSDPPISRARRVITELAEPLN